MTLAHQTRQARPSGKILNYLLSCQSDILVRSLIQSLDRNALRHLDTSSDIRVTTPVAPTLTWGMSLISSVERKYLTHPYKLSLTGKIKFNHVLLNTECSRNFTSFVLNVFHCCINFFLRQLLLRKMKGIRPFPLEIDIF